MAQYIRPNIFTFIVAQSVSLEKQQQLVGLFWSLALALILLFLFVGTAMILFRVIRRRIRLNEAAEKRKKTDVVIDPWGESAKRINPLGLEDDTEIDGDESAR